MRVELKARKNQSKLSWCCLHHSRDSYPRHPRHGNKKKTGEPEVPFWKLHMEFFEGSANVKDRTTLNFESRSLTTPNVGLFLFHQFVDPVSSSYTCDLRDRWWMGEIPGEATKNGHLNLRSFQVARGMGKKMNLLRFSTDILDVHRFSRSKSQMSSQYWRYLLVY